MDIQSQIDLINDDIHVFDRGSVPDRILIQVLSAKEYNEVQNIRSYIRRYTNKLKNVNSLEEKSRYESHLANYQTQLEEIYGRIKQNTSKPI